jgi:hypothetical protein
MNPIEQTDELTQQANQTALTRMFAVRPAWRNIVSAGAALNLEKYTVLHAGPPLLDRCNPPEPIRSSIMLTCLYEGWASTEAQAEALIQNGELHLSPAQDFACVIPLAAVIGPQSSLVEVVDTSGTVAPIWSLLSSGPPPDIRFGTRDPGCLTSMRYRDGPLKNFLLGVLNQPIDLVHLAVQGLMGGDELHLRTQAATAALRVEIQKRAGIEGLDPAATEAVSNMLLTSPGFFLTLWMAACRLYLSACEGINNCSLVTRIGANGESIGLSLGQQPDVWVTAPAKPPLGARVPHHPIDTTPAGVVGDSTVIDAMGFGGQLVGSSPDILAILSPYLPSHYESISGEIMTGLHPAFAAFGNVRSGLDARRVDVTAMTPLVNIVILAANGLNGLIGRGSYSPPAELFGKARI